MRTPIVRRDKKLEKYYLSIYSVPILTFAKLPPPCTMAKLLRVLNCMILQGNLRAPRVDMSGKTAVVTGPSPGGIGFATAQTLASFGARVILGARNREKEQKTADAIPNSTLLHLDLGDPVSVTTFSEQVETQLAGEPLDVLVCNAGIHLTQQKPSDKGVDLSFRVCILGHFYLMNNLQAKRIVSVTGEIYVLATGPADPYLKAPGKDAYARACLGRLLLLRELKERSAANGESTEFVAVHPGVSSTDMMGADGPLKSAMNAILISPEQGAQASIVAASAPSAEIHQDDILPYLHNKLGWVKLAPTDTAMDKQASVKLFEQCEELCKT